MPERPYKVVPGEPGTATVVDRASGAVVGTVCANFHGEWEAWREDSDLGVYRLRADAVEAVWWERP